MSRSAHRVLLATVGALCITGCGNGRTCCAPPPGGFLQVTTVTTGTDIDPDGYTVLTRPQITGRDSLTRPIGSNAIITWELEPAVQAVELKDVQSNCSPSGDNPRFITIVEDDTVATTFNVACS